MRKPKNKEGSISFGSLRSTFCHSFHRTRPWPRYPICLCEFLSPVLRVIQVARQLFLRFPVGDSERSQQRPTCSGVPSHNNKRDLSSGAHRLQERRPVHLFSASLNNSSSSRQLVGLCSVMPRLSSHRAEDRYLEVPSNLHSHPVDCLETQRPSNNPVRAGLYLGAPRINRPRVDLCLVATQLNQLRAADFLVRNRPLNNSRADCISAAHNNQLSSKEVLYLGTASSLPPDRQPRSLGRHNNNLPPALHCLETLNPRYLAPPPPRPSHSNIHPL